MATTATSSGGELELRGLEKRFDDVTAVDSIDLDIAAGEFFSLLGPSGCGKTTTLRMIAGFERPTAGEILLDGTSLAAVPPDRRNVNTVFQSYALFPHLNVLDNVAFGMRYQKVAQGRARAAGRGGARAGRARRPRQAPARTSSPAASSSASRSPGRSCCARRCCCSTSRSAPSTRKSAASCGSS